MTGIEQKYVAIPYVEFDLIETHLRYPEKNDHLLCQQVAGNFADIIFQDPNKATYVNEPDMEFWFTEPICGWRQGIARLYYLEEVSMQNVNWPYLSRIFDGIMRKPIENYKEGDIINGYCKSIQMHQGIYIDFGCTFLGLLPMNQEAWERANSDLPRTKLNKLRPEFDGLKSQEKSYIFRCKIRRKLNIEYFRWPIELDVIKPTWLEKYISTYGDYEPRLLVVDEHLAKISGEDLARVSGRKYNSPRSYCYRFVDYNDNNYWLQTQIDYFPEDHSKGFKRHDTSSVLIRMKKEQEKLEKKLDVGQIQLEDEHYVAGSSEWS